MNTIAKENTNTVEWLTKENIYEITAELLKDEKMRFSIVMEIATRIMNMEPITGYDICLINWVWNPECSVLWEIAWASYWRLKPQNIIYKDWRIFIVLKNIQSWWIHSHQIHEDVLIDIVSIVHHGKEKTSTLNIPITPKIEEFLKRYKVDLLRNIPTH